jgi:PEGA domain
MKLRVAIPLLAAICLATPILASGADRDAEQRRGNRGGNNRSRDYGRSYRPAPVRVAVPVRPAVGVGYRGPRYYGPSYYDHWARGYYRWSPIRYAPWSVIAGSVGFANFGVYGSIGASYAYGYPYYAPGYPYYAHGPYAHGPYPYGPHYPYAPGYDYGGVRLSIRPRDAQVFVDGHYAGLVDDFDGTFQQLRLEGGGHKIEIRMPGFEDLEMDIHVQPGRTISIREDLRPRP